MATNLKINDQNNWVFDSYLKQINTKKMIGRMMIAPVYIEDILSLNARSRASHSDIAVTAIEIKLRHKIKA